MIDLLWLVLIFIALILISRRIQQRFQAIIVLLTGSKKIAAILYFLMFFPGIIIHELSHYLVASVLLVPTGDIELLPRFEDNVRTKMGSVAVAKSDFVRSSLIGAAPIFIGSLLLYGIIYGYLKTVLQLNDFSQYLPHIINNLNVLSKPLTWILIYFLLTISNTMYSSKEDRRSWPALIGFIFIAIILIIVSGQSHNLSLKITPYIKTISQALYSSFFFVIVIDLLVLIMLYALEQIFSKITGKKVAYK